MKKRIIVTLGLTILLTMFTIVNISLFIGHLENESSKEIIKVNFLSAEELGSAVNELAWDSGFKLTSYESGEVATAIENYTLPSNHEKKIIKEELRGLTKDLSRSSYALWHQVILERYNISLALELIEVMSGEQINNK